MTKKKVSKKVNKKAAAKPVVEIDKTKMLEAYLREVTQEIEDKVLDIYGERRPYLLVVNTQDTDETVSNTISSNIEGEGITRMAMQVIRVQSDRAAAEAANKPRIVTPN